MADGVKYTLVGDKELLQTFRDLEKAVQQQALVTSVQAGGLPIQNAAKEKAPKRTRTLARSIHMEVIEASDTEVLLDIGTDLEYAAIHEYGGTIVPKKAKYLAIPLTDTARSATSPRLFPGELSFRMNRTTGKAVLIDASGAAQYALAKSVTIPARPYMRPAADEYQEDAFNEIARALTLFLGQVK